MKMIKIVSFTCKKLAKVALFYDDS